MRHCQIAVLVCLSDIISLNLHVYVNYYADHEDLSLLHVKVSISDLKLHHCYIITVVLLYIRYTDLQQREQNRVLLHPVGMFMLVLHLADDASFVQWKIVASALFTCLNTCGNTMTGQ